MTRDDAIKIFNTVLCLGKCDCSKDEIEECLKMAIEALQQQPNEDEKVIRIRKGTLKVRTGRYVIYDVEWLKEHFNTTEAKIYGQPSEDCISRQAVLEITAETGALETQTRVKALPRTIPHPKVGHWIMRKRDSSGWKDVTVYVNSEGTVTEPRDEGAYCECSECGEWLVGSDEYACGARYCPSCGLKMEEKK